MSEYWSIWSSRRKRLEKDLLCEKLRGRVQYFKTFYRCDPHEPNRFAVRVDGEEVFQANAGNWQMRYRIERNIMEEQHIPADDEERRREVAETAHIRAAEAGFVESDAMSITIWKYLNQDISSSLADEDPVIRMFAILDRRAGKRRLKEIAEHVWEQPAWLQTFYRLRLDAEGIRYRSNKAIPYN